jgi:hypothetical protein
MTLRVMNSGNDMFLIILSGWLSLIVDTTLRVHVDGMVSLSAASDSLSWWLGHTQTRKMVLLRLHSCSA